MPQPQDTVETLMSAPIILVNTLSDSLESDLVVRAINDVFRHRTGEWLVSLLEVRDDTTIWKVIVAGPDFRRTWTFDQGARDAAIVRATLERDIEATELPMGWRTRAS
jgi:hypothetical protein